MKTVNDGPRVPPPLDVTFMMPSHEGFRPMTEAELAAEKRGYAEASKEGAGGGNPFPADVSEAGAWEKGYHRGLAALTTK